MSGQFKLPNLSKAMHEYGCKICIRSKVADQPSSHFNLMHEFTVYLCYLGENPIVKFEARYQHRWM